MIQWQNALPAGTGVTRYDLVLVEGEKLTTLGAAFKTACTRKCGAEFAAASIELLRGALKQHLSISKCRQRRKEAADRAGKKQQEDESVMPAYSGPSSRQMKKQWRNTDWDGAPLA